MTPPSTHLSGDQVNSYRARQMPSAELLSVTRHLSDCAECRGRVGLTQPYLLSGSEEPHLEFEELDAWVSNRLSLPARQRVADHLAWCESCAAEEADLREFSRKLPAKPAKRHYWYLAVAAGFLLCCAGLSWRFLTPRLKPDVPYTTLMARALESGEVEMPLQTLQQLRGQSGLLRGREDNPGIIPESPIASVVRQTQPVFHWRLASTGDSTRKFEITIYSTDLLVVAKSGPLAELQWRVSPPLERGRTYLWEVSSGDLKSTSASTPTPQFAVLGDSEDRKLTEDLKSAPLLAQGLLYARLGLLEEARQALLQYSRSDTRGQRLLNRLEIR